jgi:hypothetical protein
MAYKPRIKLIISTEDSQSVSEIKAPNVTDEMYDAAWDLIYTMSTGKRRKPTPRFKKYREKRERENAKAKAAKAKRKAAARKKPKLTLVKGGAGNSDPIGLHSMVEGNRSDDQT